MAGPAAPTIASFPLAPGTCSYFCRQGALAPHFPDVAQLRHVFGDSPAFWSLVAIALAAVAALAEFVMLD